jgi:hypothetical protein
MLHDYNNEEHALIEEDMREYKEHPENFITLSGYLKKKRQDIGV